MEFFNKLKDLADKRIDLINQKELQEDNEIGVEYYENEIENLDKFIYELDKITIEELEDKFQKEIIRMYGTYTHVGWMRVNIVDFLKKSPFSLYEEEFDMYLGRLVDDEILFLYDGELYLNNKID